MAIQIQNRGGSRAAPTGLSAPSRALRSCAAALVCVALFSGMINLLGLTGSLYMLQVYDRVLPSHSIPTLTVLSIAMAGLYIAYGLLDLLRLRLLARIGRRFDTSLQPAVFALSVSLPLRSGQEGTRLQPIGDLDQIRSFISGSGPTAFFDLPWLPFYLVGIFFLHPLLGALATGGAIVSVLLTLVAEGLSRGPAKRAMESSISRRQLSDAGRRNAEVVRALGMGPRISRLWQDRSEAYLANQLRITDVVGATGTVSRTWRMILQSLMLGLGAYLVIEGEASPGVMIATSIMLARALSPVDLVIANWRPWVSARQSYGRLTQMLRNADAQEAPLTLPRPRETLSVEAISVGAPGQQKPIIQNVAFSLQAGAGLGVIGASASGKSTLARALVGAWTPLRGTVRLDAAALDQFDEEALGRDIGYLPQDIELFEGTVAENINRFNANASADAVVAAAEAAGVKQMILRLSDGFQTRIGEGGSALSGGQRQMVGLARALYGDPFLVVLDEPNSNLDGEGDIALGTAIRGVRDRGGIIVVIAHRPAALANIDNVLVMAGGTVQAMGPRDEVLAKMTRPANVRPEQNPGGERVPTVVTLHDRRP